MHSSEGLASRQPFFGCIEARAPVALIRRRGVDSVESDVCRTCPTGGLLDIRRLQKCGSYQDPPRGAQWKPIGTVG